MKEGQCYDLQIQVHVRLSTDAVDAAAVAAQCHLLLLVPPAADSAGVRTPSARLSLIELTYLIDWEISISFPQSIINFIS